MLQPKKPGFYWNIFPGNLQKTVGDLDQKDMALGGPSLASLGMAAGNLPRDLHAVEELKLIHAALIQQQAVSKPGAVATTVAIQIKALGPAAKSGGLSLAGGMGHH